MVVVKGILEVVGQAVYPRQELGHYHW